MESAPLHPPGARLRDKVAVITGSGSGIGRACLHRFASEGACVVASGRTAATLEESLARAAVMPNRGRAVVADLSEERDVERLIAEALDRFGRIDILVHAAGVSLTWEMVSPGSMGIVTETAPDKWDEVVRLNLRSYFLTTRAVLPGMVAQGSGSIVAIASMSGVRGIPIAHAYSAAKAGIVNLTRSIAVTYAHAGVRANGILPGFVDTPMIASMIDQFDDPEQARRLTPMARAGRPEEIAAGCLYLASDEASYCNGTMLVIDGGAAARQ